MKKHIMILILLVIVLVSCSKPNNDSSLTDFVDLENKENEVEQEKYNGHEEPILKPDSDKKEVNDNKEDAPALTTPKEAVDDITYGSIRYEDTSISFKTLPSVNDSSKDQGTSGYISKGSNGLSRKEVRDVYVNGKFSHTETVKDTYIITEPIHQQQWVGTKEDSWEDMGYYFYQEYDSFETCNIQADDLARIKSKEGWLSTLCDGPNLYYTLKD